MINQVGGGIIGTTSAVRLKARWPTLQVVFPNNPSKVEMSTSRIFNWKSVSGASGGREVESGHHIRHCCGMVTPKTSRSSSSFIVRHHLIQDHHLHVHRDDHDDHDGHGDHEKDESTVK